MSARVVSVHLIHRELFAELSAQGFCIAAGQLGENITTEGVDLLALPEGTELQPGEQLNRFALGLMHAVPERAADGTLARKAVVMSVVLVGGVVTPGDVVRVDLPAVPHRALEKA